MFLSDRPAAAAMQSLRDAYSGPEKMQLHGAELYIEYGSGMGTSKLSLALIERKLGVAGGPQKAYRIGQEVASDVGQGFVG